MNINDTMAVKIADFYLDYFNNYLSVELIAEHHFIPTHIAQELIDYGRKLHESKVKNRR